MDGTKELVNRSVMAELGVGCSCWYKMQLSVSTAHLFYQIVQVLIIIPIQACVGLYYLSTCVGYGKVDYTPML